LQVVGLPDHRRRKHKPARTAAAIGIEDESLVSRFVHVGDEAGFHVMAIQSEKVEIFLESLLLPHGCTGRIKKSDIQWTAFGPEFRQRQGASDYRLVLL